MNKWLIAALLLVIIGIFVLMLIGFITDWDLSKLGTGSYQTNTYDITDDFNKLSFETETADIVFLPSEDGKCKVICYENENLKNSVSVEDNTLTVKNVDTRKWYQHIGINFESPKITVYLPKEDYATLTIDESTGDVEIPKDFKFGSIGISVSTGDVTCYASSEGDIQIESSTGRVYLENVTAKSLCISLSTGNVTVKNSTFDGDVSVKLSTGNTELSHVSCKNVVSDGSTGDITLTDTTASEKFSIERSTGDVLLEGSFAAEIRITTDTGDVRLDRADASEIFIETDTGKVKGSLLTEKIFIVKTDTGKVEVPSSTSGGRCEITTDTGDIKISIYAE